MTRKSFNRGPAARVALIGAMLVPVAALAATNEQVRQATAATSASAPLGGSVASMAGSAVPALGIGAIAQTVAGLALVIALVFGCAWVARRFGLQPSRKAGLVRVIGGASLGQKERIAVIEIGDTWLVVGAAPGNVRTLHVMPAGSTDAGAPIGASDGRTDVGPGTSASSGASGRSGTPKSFGDAFRDELRKRFKLSSALHSSIARRTGSQ